MYEDPVCKFCGKNRRPLKGGYAICNCGAAQEEYQAMVPIMQQKKNLEIMLEAIERNIKIFTDRAEKLTAKSNLGRRFSERTFENFDKDVHGEAYTAAEMYADAFEDNKGEGLMFLGTVGTGKTHLAAAIVNRIILNLGIPVRFITSIELFGVLRDFENHANTLKEIKEIPLLVIDDLGKEKVTEWNREKLFEIVNARYENYLPIVITSNCTPRELEVNLGTATFSRLCEICKGIVMNGEDHRKGVRNELRCHHRQIN